MAVGTGTNSGGAQPGLSALRLTAALPSFEVDKRGV